MNGWTADKVLALAPDAGAADAGRGLASARKWTLLCVSDRAIWGLCQGSGKQPYQTRVDLREPAFKCSCPSRKFPCKHGLGLLLLFAADAKNFKSEAEPGWVGEWLESRGERAEKKAEKVKAAAEAPVDLEAQAKRAAARDARVKQGVAECRTWLDDLIRRGLAAAQSDATSDCERVAARMVDAQAPGLAAFIRRIPRVMASGLGWEVRTTDYLGRLHLLLEAAVKIDQLPDEPHGGLRADVRAALGYTQSKDEVLAAQAVPDRWAVLGQAFEEDDRLTVRRTWLWGTRSGTPALVLDFAVGGQTLDPSLAPGTSFEGELAFYPAAAPLRALVKSRAPDSAGAGILASEDQGSIAANLDRFARAVAANPWVHRWPFVLSRTRLVKSGEQWLLAQASHTLPLTPEFERGMQLWRLLAATQGREATIVAEWDGEAALPVGLFLDQDASHFIGLVPRWAA